MSSGSCPQHFVMPNTATEMRDTDSGILWLLQLSDSALPTGAFSHSFGLETYLQHGVVDGADGFADWLHGYLRQMAYVDALAIRLAADAARAGDDERVARVDQLLHASAVPRQIREAGSSMGQRMNRIASVSFPGALTARRYRTAIEEGTCHGHPAVVFALVAHDAGVGGRTSVVAYLMQLATSLTQNAIRAIPLGQDAGQRVLSGARELIPAIVDEVYTLDERDLGAGAPGLEIAQMAHETQRARMFMS